MIIDFVNDCSHNEKAVKAAERTTAYRFCSFPLYLSFRIGCCIIIQHMIKSSTPPTKIQKQILDFIKNYSQENGYAPTLKEIGEELGGRSTTTIYQHIEALQAKGYLSKKENSPRSLVAETEEQITIPLSGTIAAGAPIGVFEDPVPIAVPKSMVPQREDYYALKVSGNSMVDDGIWDNDIVIIRRQNAANYGDVIVAIITDEFGNESATLKTYYPRSGEIELKPQNPKLKSFFVKPQELEIRGKFTGLIRSS